MIVELYLQKLAMNNLGKNQQQKCNDASGRKCIVDERFEQNAGVKIHKGRESYGGGNGFYAARPRGNCPNVNDPSRRV
jgi:hypothetical protein